MRSPLLFFVEVEGESCWPDLVPGRRYFASPLLRPKVGRFAVFRNPADQAIVVKRIEAVSGGHIQAGGTVSWSNRYLLPHSAFIAGIFTNRDWLDRSRYEGMLLERIVHNLY